MPSYPVKFYTNTMEGAPTISNAFGELTNLLDKCIVTGFGTKNVTAITNDGSVATVYFGTTHGFLQHQIIKIQGANESGYNGEQRVTSIAPTSLTFNIASGVPSPATGDLICSIPPLGFEISYTGTNKRIYRSTNVNSNRFYFRVDDSQAAGYTSTYAKRGKVTVLRKDPMHVDGPYQNGVFDGMQMPYDVTNPSKNHIPTGSPASGTTIVDGWFKWFYSNDTTLMAESTAASAGTHAWTLIGDDRGFYFFPTPEAVFDTTYFSDSDTRAPYCFTEFESYIPGDSCNTILTASDWNQMASVSTAGTTDNVNYSNNGAGYAIGINTSWYGYSNTGKLCMANHTGYGMPASFHFMYVQPTITTAVAPFRSGLSGTGNGYPVTTSWYGITLTPVWIRQSTDGVTRGIMPGLFFIANNIGSANILASNEILENVAGYAGKKLLAVKVNVSFGLGNPSNPGRFLFDITGPWH